MKALFTSQYRLLGTILYDVEDRSFRVQQHCLETSFYKRYPLTNDVVSFFREDNFSFNEMAGRHPFSEMTGCTMRTSPFFVAGAERHKIGAVLFSQQIMIDKYIP